MPAKKTHTDIAEASIIAPIWPTQVWFNLLLELFIDIPRILFPSRNLLTLPGLSRVHPLHRKLILMACRLSGYPSANRRFQLELQKTYCNHGEVQQRNSIQYILKMAFIMCKKENLCNLHFCSYRTGFSDRII
jgi:hypothetical protein